MGFFGTLFSRTGLLIGAYLIIGVLVNTASPHLPSGSGSGLDVLHSWVQYAVSVFFWPLSFWHPHLTVGEWH